MKRQHAVVALVLLGTSLCVDARESSDRKIRMECSPDRAPMMADVVRAIEFSDYTASPPARRQILARAQEVCERNPTGVMTFVPHRDDARLVSK